MMGAVKRGNREITIEAKDGVQKKYLVPLTTSNPCTGW